MAIRDYTFIKHFAKTVMKDCKIGSKSGSISTTALYGDAFVEISIGFKGKRSDRIIVDLEEVYNTYGSRWSSVTEMTKDFADKYAFYDFEELDGGYPILFCDLNTYHIDHTASQALSNIGILVKCLNEFLGRNEENFYDESTIRSLHQDYLQHSWKKHFWLTLAWIVLAVASIGLGFYIVTTNPAAGVGPAALFLVGIVSLFGIIVQNFIRLYYKRTLTKAQANVKEFM